MLQDKIIKKVLDQWKDYLNVMSYFNESSLDHQLYDADFMVNLLK